MSTPKGEMRRIEIAGEATEAFCAIHHSGSGPGIVLLADDAGLDAGMRARAALFAEEGYVVLALAGLESVRDVVGARDALSAMEALDGGIGVVGHGAGGVLACRAAASFDAAVAFDATGLAAAPDILTGTGCPTVLVFGTSGDGDAEAAAARLRAHVERKIGGGLFVHADARPGFAIPHRPAFDKRIDSLAHTRALEVLRRAIGPHYDYVALFAEHIRHEFETRDVDATMATMIDQPYVNHAPTLAGGVGHDMLKRFYKYHFVHQNSRERSSTLVSQTIGPDRIVIEMVVRFRHDEVLDRYFPGIEPTDRIVEIPTLLFVKFRGDKVCHEHIYWDQGSALKQIGVLDAGDLPIAGPEAARKVLDETEPSNIFMEAAWATSEGKPI